ncbi:hypothetical protein [Parapedobacter tibetensis]|uniref:hypothetical protein n=1 Tax=Parapedobacter tibetensis TaxID=2972951 RepID=UPI00214DD304|nr:hypothetical protein [Parapedobacter tibetensis]
MDQYPFTTAGVKAWQLDLHAAPDDVIEEEAGDAESNMKGWLMERFSLTQDQQDYLVALDNALTQHWGESIAYFIRCRLPIELNKPDVIPEVRSSKLVLSDEELETLEGATKLTAAAMKGRLRFTITY